jgi:hypothetical protein
VIHGTTHIAAADCSQTARWHIAVFRAPPTALDTIFTVGVHQRIDGASNLPQLEGIFAFVGIRVGGARGCEARDGGVSIAFALPGRRRVGLSDFFTMIDFLYCVVTFRY